jgi:hypothetical protein
MTLPIATGIELGLWVTDLEGTLADGRAITRIHPRIEDEFGPYLLEIKTRPHDSERALRADPDGLFRTAIETARAHDRRLVPLGTPLADGRMAATGPGGQFFEAIYGAGILPGKNCAGAHIHFEQANVRRQLDVLTALDPALALVSASPYYRRRRSQ